MSAPTGDPKITAELNGLLGRELGRNEYGDPFFTWRWSEDCFWPAFATGKVNVVETKVLTPIVGAPADTHDFEAQPPFIVGCIDGAELGRSEYPVCIECGQSESDLVHNVYSIMQRREPEYRRDRQLRKRDTWYICKWLTPWELILGPNSAEWLAHGDQQKQERIPSTQALIAAWNRQNPGANFPSRGWRIPTDAYLPNGPQDENWSRSPYGHTSPHIQDTEHFIRQVKFQTSRPGNEVLQDMLDSEDAENKRSELLIGDEIRNDFTAFLNPKPGARGRASGGGFVSMPWSRVDRER